jgi:transcriptional regulator with XRE-family HTH domain
MVYWRKGGDPVHFTTTIPERIGDLRTSRNLSQRELSEMAGVAPSQLSRIESGKIKTISSDILVRLAKALHVSTDYIVGLTTVSTPKSYDISELKLSEDTVKALVLGAVDIDILNRLIAHKSFPYLTTMIRRYFDNTTAVGVVDRNGMIDFATSVLGDFAEENSEHRAEVREDIRYLKSEKIGAHEAEIEKIRSTFIKIIHDIKKELDEEKRADQAKPLPLSTTEFMRGMWEQLKDKPPSEITADEVTEAMMNMVRQTTTLDDKGAELLRKMAAHLFRSSKED